MRLNESSGRLTEVLLTDDGEETEGRERNEENGTSEWGAVILLTLTAMGAGILSLPVSIYYGGWVLGFAALFVFALLADYSLILIVRCAQKTGERSVVAIARNVYGRKGEMVVIAVTLILLVFAQIAMLIVVGDVMTPAVQYFATGDVYESSCDDSERTCHAPQWAGTTRCDDECTLPPWWASRLAVSVVATLLYFPLSLFDDLKALSSTSTIAVVMLVGVIVALCVELGRKGASSSRLDVVTPKSRLWNLLMIPSILACAFCCHFNVLAVHQSMRSTVRHRIESVIHKSMIGIVLIMYGVCGTTGYLLFADKLKDCTDILTCFDAKDTIMLACSIAIGLINIVKMPLLALPTRSLCLELWTQLRTRSTERSVASDIEESSAGDVDNESRKTITTAPSTKMSFIGRVTMMLILSLIVLVLAVVMSDLALGFSVIGFSSGIAVCFIIPGALYDAVVIRENAGKVSPVSTARLGPLGLIAFGLVMSLLSLVGIICFILYN